MLCLGDKACVYPIVKDGLCAIHLRDRVDQHKEEFVAGVQPLPPAVEGEKEFEDPPLRSHATVNHISEASRNQAVELFKRGASTRQVVKEVGIAQVTALRIAKDMDDRPKLCSCGRENGHRGWCKKRVEANPARQETLKKLHKERSSESGANFKMSELRAKLEEEKAELLKKVEAIDQEIEACNTIARIATRYKVVR